MRKQLLILSLLLSIISASILYSGTINAETPEPYNAEESFKLAENAIFYLRVLKSDGKASSTGTGIILSPGGTAATAYHVVKGAERIEGVMADGSTVGPIKVIKYDELKDTAVLELPDPQDAAISAGAYAYLPVRKEPVRHGEQVFALGYPLKNTAIITEGIINTPEAVINGKSRILTSAQIASGMSGGPLLDQHGELAGIISGSLRTMNNIHLIINMSDLRSLLPAKLK